MRLGSTWAAGWRKLFALLAGRMSPEVRRGCGGMVQIRYRIVDQLDVRDLVHRIRIHAWWPWRASDSTGSQEFS